MTDAGITFAGAVVALLAAAAGAIYSTRLPGTRGWVVRGWVILATLFSVGMFQCAAALR